LDIFFNNNKTITLYYLRRRAGEELL